MSSPGDKVQRPDRREMESARKDDLVEVHRESERMKDEVTRPEYRPTEKIAYAKWKIKMVYAYLAFTALLCVGAIVIEPALDVRLVVLAVWAATSAALGALLRTEYKKKP